MKKLTLSVTLGPFVLSSASVTAKVRQHAIKANVSVGRCIFASNFPRQTRQRN